MTIIEQLKAKGACSPTRLTADSRRVQPGDVFVAFPGAQVDGRDFIAQALGAGRGRGACRGRAKDQLERRQATADTVLEVEGLAALSGELAHLVYGRPSETSGWRASPAPTARPLSRNGSPRR
jgi:UDP-N-acetylmuramyl tripeptide synthase